MSEDTTPKAAKLSEDERRIRIQLARSLWALDLGEDVPKDAAERKAAFGAARKDYMRKAAKLVSRLPRRGVALSWTGTQESGDA